MAIDRPFVAGDTGTWHSPRNNPSREYACNAPLVTYPVLTLTDTTKRRRSAASSTPRIALLNSITVYLSTRITPTEYAPPASS